MLNLERNLLTISLNTARSHFGWTDVFEKHTLDGECDVVVEDDMNVYKRMAREHDSRQPFIEEELIEAIIRYNCVTHRQLAGRINN
jgi:hypothetical protein